jgi:hypothetical protein
MTVRVPPVRREAEARRHPDVVPAHPAALHRRLRGILMMVKIVHMSLA